MSRCSGCFYILFLLKLINIINAMPPVRSPQEDIIFFEEEMSATDEEVLARKNPYFPISSKTKTHSLITFEDTNRVLFPEKVHKKVTFRPHKNIPQSLLKISQISTCTERDNFCENVDTYPYVHLKDILQRNKFLKDVFQNKHVEEEVIARIDDNDTFLCPSEVKTIIPKLGKNMKEMWKYIINQDDFIQTVRVEVCRKDGEPCDLIRELPNGYITECKQKYIYTKLLSLGSSGEPVIETFQLPSACACSYRRDYGFFARIGSRFTPARRKGSNVLRYFLC